MFVDVGDEWTSGGRKEGARYARAASCWSLCVSVCGVCAHASRR